MNTVLPALDVARYIINYCNAKDYRISNLKLQKLLYFVQAYFLAFTDDKEPCFKEKIEAWDFGPVVPEVYYEFKQYGSSHIPPVRFYLERGHGGNVWTSKKIKYDSSNIPEEKKKKINDVIDEFSAYSASELVSITHNQKPWKNAYHKNYNNEITIKSIREYFEADE